MCYCECVGKQDCSLLYMVLFFFFEKMGRLSAISSKTRSQDRHCHFFYIVLYISWFIFTNTIAVITLLLSSIHRTLLNNFSLSFHVVVGSKPIHQCITQLVKNCFVTCCVKSSAWFSFPATLCTFLDVFLWHLLCQHSLCFKMFCSFSGSKSL